ncbi:hypothetical protein EV209_0695 [Cuneatibacter caecimuris]|uniref:Uncharacterized protein n=2 Tax=Cuneatibacter caecimuris TaxID=1796618 RepID=A0A4Q7PNV4_9FIRM|nr:hypothetical protein EV209_0695 [Cuneatibacter caecimuris]
MEGIDHVLQQILNRLDGLDSKVTDLQLTLENETNKNIQLIAEGHLDLNRKSDDSLRLENEKEMLLIRENELRRVKTKIEEIA